MTVSKSIPPVRIREFSFKNPSGGTAGTFLKYGPPLAPSSSLVVLRRAIYDYEVGWRMAGVSADDALTAYLDAHAHPQDKRVYFSEHELAGDGQDIHALVLSFAKTLRVIRTADGKVFRLQSDGSWRAGDIRVQKVEHLLEDCDLVLDADDSEAEGASS